MSSTSSTRLRRRPKPSLRQQNLPTWLTDQPPIDDGFDTLSSKLQKETAEECLPYLLGTSAAHNPITPTNEHRVPRLQGTSHAQFCRMMLGELPAGYAALDASRPWMLYWCLSSLALLGEDVAEYREAVVSTLTPLQNSTGGFAGGHGQYSHLATSYAALLSLVIVGGEAAYKLIDREAMWHWLGKLKQPGGEFQMSVEGESDTRGAYCAMVMISLLNLPTSLPTHSPAYQKGDETFLTGLAEWVGRCQSFDGGIASAPGFESHGAYTFCALACLCILGNPYDIMNKHLDVTSLVNWLATRQHAPEGGLAGRANKLVDGCYSHWIGGCWSLAEAGAGISGIDKVTRESFFDREGLIRYILCCCQSKRGGLRDKPSKRPDAYHTCYNLYGLSSAQHYYYYQDQLAEDLRVSLGAAFGWRNSKTENMDEALNGTLKDNRQRVFDPNDFLPSIHPVYVVPAGTAESMRRYFEQNSEF